MSEHLEGQIGDAARVKAFIEDPVIKAALERVHTQCYKDFRSPDDKKAGEARALSQALDRLAQELQGVKDRGVYAEKELERSTPRNGRGTPKSH